MDVESRMFRIKTIEVFGDILKYNKFQAKHNRECFEEHKIYAINLMSTSCSGNHF